MSGRVHRASFRSTVSTVLRFRFAEQAETTTIQQTIAEDEKADEAPKAPATSDLIANTIASIKQKQQADLDLKQQAEAMKQMVQWQGY